MIYRPHLPLKGTLCADNRAFRSQMETETWKTLSLTIARTSAHSAYPQSFIKGGLIRLKWF